MSEGRAYRRRIWLIAGGIAVFATGQAVYALSIGAPQFFRDATEWIYDVLLYGVAALVFGRGAAGERASALAIALILAVAGLHTLWDLWDKIVHPRPIDVGLLGFSAGSAIAIAYLVVALLLRFRRSDNPLVLATWISSRNDAITTTLYASLNFAARTGPARWPEYALDLFGAALAFQGAGAITWAAWRDRQRRAGRETGSDQPRPFERRPDEAAEERVGLEGP